MPGVLCDQGVEHGGEVRDSVDGLLIDGDSATRNAASEQKVLDILDMEIVGRGRCRLAMEKAFETKKKKVDRKLWFVIFSWFAFSPQPNPPT